MAKTVLRTGGSVWHETKLTACEEGLIGHGDWRGWQDTYVLIKYKDGIITVSENIPHLTDVYDRERYPTKYASLKTDKIFNLNGEVLSVKFELSSPNSTLSHEVNLELAKRSSVKRFSDLKQLGVWDEEHGLHEVDDKLSSLLFRAGICIFSKPSTSVAFVEHVGTHEVEKIYDVKNCELKSLEVNFDSGKEILAGLGIINVKLDEQNMRQLLHKGLREWIDEKEKKKLETRKLD